MNPAGLAPLSADSLERIKQGEEAAVQWYNQAGEPWPIAVGFDFSANGVMLAIEKVIRLQQALAGKLIAATLDVHRPDDEAIGRLKRRVRTEITNHWIAFSMVLKEEPGSRHRRLTYSTEEERRKNQDRAAFETWRYPHPDYWREVWNDISKERNQLCDLWEPSITRAIDEAVNRHAPAQVIDEAPPRPPEQAQRVFRKEGDFWTVMFEGKTIRIKDGKGLRYLSYLLNEAEREFSASELVRAVSGKLEATARSSAGEVLDDRAMADYRSRAESLQTEIEQARQFNDTGRVQLLQDEMEALTEQITSATGLGGRRRSVGDSLDQARKAVSVAIVRIIGRIKKTDPALGAHLNTRVTRGTFLSYRGDGIPWNS